MSEPATGAQAPNSAGAGQGAEQGTKATLKASECFGQAFAVVAGRDTPGLYGPQVAMQVEGGQHVIYVSAKSSIAKGLKSGRLKFPFRVTPTTAYGKEGPFTMWTLAPKVGAAKAAELQAGQAAPPAAGAPSAPAATATTAPAA